MIIKEQISNPPLRKNTYAERMEDQDQGIINAWLTGISMQKDQPEIAEQASRGELPVLPYRGGVTKAIKAKKVGALHYVAMWQGLRGDDLCVDTEQEPTMTCSKTGMVVTFTLDIKKLFNQSETEEL